MDEFIELINNPNATYETKEMHELISYLVKTIVLTKKQNEQMNEHMAFKEYEVNVVRERLDVANKKIKELQEEINSLKAMASTPSISTPTISQSTDAIPATTNGTKARKSSKKKN